MNPSNYENLKKQALVYLKLGWPMLPLFNYSKNPATGQQFHPFFWENPETKERSLEEREGWTQKQGWWPYQKRKQTRKEVESWIYQDGLTGIGIVTGATSGIVVVDEDSYKENGKSFDKKTPLKSITTSGGKHHFFKYNPLIATTGYQKGINVEIKAEGGFVVVCPTLAHNKQGEIGKYQWINSGFKSMEDLPTLEQADIVDLKINEEKHEKLVLSDYLNVELGSQHNSLRSFTNSYLSRFKTEDWKAIVYPAVRAHAKNYKPPHDPQRVERMLQDCSEFILRKRNEKIAPKSISTVVQQRILDKELEKEPIMTGYPTLDNILKGLIQGRLYCLSGLSNAGKTQTSANFSVNVAKQGKRVLYFALEPDANIVDYLASAQTGKPYDSLTDEDLMSISPNIEIYTKDQIPDIDKMIDVIHKLPRYDLIIVDHIGYFIKGDSNAGPLQEQENVTKRLVSLAKQKKSAIIFIVHMRKKQGGFKRKDEGERLPSMEELKGSSAFYQDSTDVLFVTRAIGGDDITQEDYGKLVVVKTKSGKNGIVPIYFHRDSAKISEQEEASREIF